MKPSSWTSRLLGSDGSACPLSRSMGSGRLSSEARRTGRERWLCILQLRTQQPPKKRRQIFFAICSGQQHMSWGFFEAEDLLLKRQ